MMKRTLTAILIGLIVGTARLLFSRFPSDLFWPHCAARALLAGHDPYGAACVSLRPDGVPWVVNPLPTALVLLPLAPLPLDLATAIILGLSSALLAWGLLETGDPFRLLIFLSAPFVFSWYYGQWSVLILALALSPAWLPLVLVKPHIGLPALLTHLTRRRLLGALLFGLLSLLVMPDWPWRWLATLGTYDGYSIVLVVPLPLLLLLRWRDPRARYLLLCAIFPQRGIYDALITAAVLRSRLHIALWVVVGWAPILLCALLAPRLNADPIATIGLYLATTALLLPTSRRFALGASDTCYCSRSCR